MRSLRSAAVIETERHTSADTASIIFDPSINGQLDAPGRFDAVAPRVQDIEGGALVTIQASAELVLLVVGKAIQVPDQVSAISQQEEIDIISVVIRPYVQGDGQTGSTTR